MCYDLRVRLHTMALADNQRTNKHVWCAHTLIKSNSAQQLPFASSMTGA